MTTEEIPSWQNLEEIGAGDSVPMQERRDDNAEIWFWPAFLVQQGQAEFSGWQETFERAFS